MVYLVCIHSTQTLVIQVLHIIMHEVHKCLHLSVQISMSVLLVITLVSRNVLTQRVPTSVNVKVVLSLEGIRDHVKVCEAAM